MERGFGTGACAAKPETPSPPEREKGGSQGVMSYPVRVSTSSFGTGQRWGNALQREWTNCVTCPLSLLRRSRACWVGSLVLALLHLWEWLSGWTQRMQSWTQRDAAMWTQSWCCGMKGSGDDARPSKELMVINTSC